MIDLPKLMAAALKKGSGYKGVLRPRYTIFQIEKRMSGPGMRGPVYRTIFRDIKSKTQAKELLKGLRKLNDVYMLDEITFAELRDGREGMEEAKQRVINRNFPECLDKKR